MAVTTPRTQEQFAARSKSRTLVCVPSAAAFVLHLPSLYICIKIPGYGSSACHMAPDRTGGGAAVGEPAAGLALVVVLSNAAGGSGPLRHWAKAAQSCGPAICAFGLLAFLVITPSVPLCVWRLPGRSGPQSSSSSCGALAAWSRHTNLHITRSTTLRRGQTAHQDR